MENSIGKKVKLKVPVRSHKDGKAYFEEQPTVIKIIEQLGKSMALVKFDDGATTFLFESEMEIL